MVHDFAVLEIDAARAKDRGLGILLEGEDHLPLDEDGVALHDGTVDAVFQTARARGEALGHGREVLHAAQFLYRVLEDDVLAIVG